MDLLQNPFHVLTANPRDNRRKINELAEERSLLIDTNECMDARSELTNPRKRLSAEIAWLPGARPKKAEELLSQLESSPEELIEVDNLSETARANLLAAALLRLPKISAEDLSEWLIELAYEFEEFDSEKLRLIISEERIVSGFPEVSDISAVEAEIQERRKYYVKIMKSSLDNLPANELIETVTNVVESATGDGENHGPILIDDLVDMYEVEAQGFLDKEEGNIELLVEKLQSAVDSEQPDTVLAPLVSQLIKVVKNWDAVAQPIQVSAMSRGLEHEASHRVARKVRDLAIHMFNEHGKLDFSQQITGMLQEVFAEVGTVAEQTAEDSEALDEIHENIMERSRLAEEDAKQWAEEISIRTAIPVSHFSREEFSISPEGVSWKGSLYSLESITRIRWGGVRDGRRALYSIYFGDNHNIENLRTADGKVFQAVIDKMWRAVGVRLIIDLVKGFSEGNRYSFGNAVVEDGGVHLTKKRFWGSDERVFGDWSKVKIWSSEGSFCLGMERPQKVEEGLSYLEVDNAHVLEAAIRTAFKRGYSKLSDLLEG